ncbi:endogenous retrovirus group PABLB member 1 Env polyprotein-like [Arapaima gigas]
MVLEKWCSTSNTQCFFIIICLQYGTARTAHKLINMATSLEKLVRKTADSIKDINSTMVFLCTGAMQNRLALDYLLAAQGGTHVVTGSERCTSIPENSEHIALIADKIQGEGKKFSNYNQ